MKKIIDKEYNEHAQFNLTRLIRRNFEAGTPLPKEYFDGLDFLEEANKNLLLPVNAPYGKQHRYLVRESLAENIVGLLPLEYYKQYIQPTWIVKDDGETWGVVQRALNDQNYEFLYELLDLSKDYLKDHSNLNKEEDRKFIGTYENSLLAPILTLNANLMQLNSLRVSQSNYDGYMELFKKALVDFKEYYAQKYEVLLAINHNKDILFDDKSWFRDYGKLESSFRKTNRSSNILETVAKDPKAFNFYKDIFNQYGKDEKNPFFDLDLFKLALKYGNKKVVGHLCENKAFNAKDINHAFESLINNWVDDQKDKIYGNLKNQLYDKSAYFKNLLNIVQKNVSNHKIEDYSLFSNILLASNKEFVDEILDRYPKLFEEKLNHDLTLSQWHYARELFNDFMQENGLKVVEAKNGCNYSSFEIYYLQNLTEHVIPSKELTLDEKLAVNEVVAQYHLPRLETDLSKKEMLSLFHNFSLNKQIPQRSNDSKRVKI